MKRSEMIDLLADYLAASYDRTWNEKKDHVSKMLSFLEVQGMSPPAIQSQLLKPKDYRWGLMCTIQCTCEDCIPGFPVYKWEPE